MVPMKSSGYTGGRLVIAILFLKRREDMFEILKKEKERSFPSSLLNT
jgi:hypothetical protein